MGSMTDGPRKTPGQAPEDDPRQRSQTVVVVGPDGRPVGTAAVEAGDEAGEEGDPSRLVEQPAKVMRIGSMIKQLLEEVRAAPLDEAGRNRLKMIHARSISELEDGLAPELRDELERLSLPFQEEGAPSEPELRIAQAQLVGWLEGLFHGMQAALVAQQMAARAQLEQMRRGVPALEAGIPGEPGRHPGQDQAHGTGQYL
ncbi:MAG: bacterial proteasome activator family protein [Micromonosporaceae bacterium]